MYTVLFKNNSLHDGYSKMVMMDWDAQELSRENPVSSIQGINKYKEKRGLDIIRLIFGVETALC